MRKVTLFAACLALIATALAAPLSASSRFPERIALPDGFRPEGIAIGNRATFYVGSIPTGAIYRGSLRTGEGAILNPGGAGRAAIGLELKRGKLYVAGGRTGATTEIALNEAVVNGDGLLLDGRTLYVVQNRDNKVAVVRLARDWSSGRVVRHITDPDFDVPTTIDEFGNRLYAVNARFRPTPPPPDFEYWLAQFRKARG